MRSHRWLVASAVLVCLCANAQESAGDNPKQRVKAAKELGKSGSEAIPQLAAMLKDPSVDVRQEAVRSIVEIGTQYSLDPLIAATSDNDPDVQIRAVDGIVNFYLPGYVESGLQRLGSAVRKRFDRENTQVIDPYVNVREDAIAAIAKLVRGGASMESRATAARAIGVLRGKPGLDELIDGGLKGKDSTVIYESLISIQKIRDVSAGPRVVFLLRDLDEHVQIAAIETAGLLKTKEAVPDLQKLFRDSRSEKVRRSALAALAMIADPSSRPLFHQGFTDKSEEIRTAAAEGFARLKDTADRAEVESAFNEERKMGPRLADAFALVSLGQIDTGELSPLTYLVNTLNSKSYRDVARPYLVELARGEAVRKALYQRLPQGTRDEKIGLVRVLSVSGDRESVPHIEALTKDSDVEVAQEAIRALRNLQSRLG
jgi:HEAT repeat protein